MLPAQPTQAYPDPDGLKQEDANYFNTWAELNKKKASCYFFVLKTSLR
jgi:hypothetical protein